MFLMALVLFTPNKNDRQIISINVNIIWLSICRYITIRIYIKYIATELKISGKYKKFYGFPYLHIQGWRPVYPKFIYSAGSASR